MVMHRQRGRERRVPNEQTKRIKISFSESELELLRVVAQLNLVTIAEFVRDAVNDAAEECGATPPCFERRRGERRGQAERPPLERRRAERRRRIS